MALLRKFEADNAPLPGACEPGAAQSATATAPPRKLACGDRPKAKFKKLILDFERYRDIVENMVEHAIYTMDDEGRITSWNSAAERMFGYSAAQVMGQDERIFATDANRAAEIPQNELAEAVRNGRTHSDNWQVSQNGSLIWSSSVLTAVYDASANLTGFVRVARDMTDQKLLEERIGRLAADLEIRAVERTRELESTIAELKRKQEEVEAFVYIVSHDLRAPLVNVQGFTRELEESCGRLGALLSSCALAEPYREAVDEILGSDIPGALHFIFASSSKFERLIDALLGLSRHGRQVYRMSELDMKGLALDTVESMQRQILEAEADISVGNLPGAFGDPTAIEQVLANLLVNCLKYRSPDRPLKVEIGGALEDGNAHFWIRDNGLGISDFGKARLFQVFQRLHPDRAPGEGMGLAIAHRIVERHQGKIWAESQEDHGSVFHFTIPAGTPCSGIETMTGV